MTDPTEYNVRAVERALQILGCFDQDHLAQGVSEIAHAVGLHKATTHRIVMTLVNYGYLERADDGKYRLGMRLADLGFRVIGGLDLRRAAYPFMTQLVERWDETCDLGVFDHGQVFYIEVVRSHQQLLIASAVGQRLAAHATASGKLFLAHLPPDEVDAILSRPLRALTTKTVTSPVELRRQLEVIRRQGYGFDEEENEVGIRAVSAPICDQEGSVVAVMSMPGPTSRMTPDRVTAIIESLKEASEAVARRMGWRAAVDLNH